MAVYKVIQDIESEDKLLGPLTLKGLIYAGIVVMCSFINFKLVTASALGPIKWIFVLALLGPTILFGVLASPLGREQPTEVWLLARVRFLLMNRKRIWDQTGVTHLVTITVPKKVEQILTKNFSQTEVKSRLSALANTLDSRGWVIKNVNINAGVPSYLDYANQERLVESSSLTQEVPEVVISAAEDILDEKNNPTAHNFQSLMVQAEQDRRNKLQEKLEVARTEYLGQLPAKSNEPPKIHDLKARPAKGYGKLPAKMTSTPDAAKLELANSGNDLSVASIAKLANRNDVAGGEISIALH